MTKVIRKLRRGAGAALCVLLLAIFAGSAQSLAASATSDGSAPLHSAEDLFLQLGRVELDPSRVYHIRSISLDHPGFSITLNDGVIGFTADVAGAVTGAFFEGDGEILLMPPNQVERGSMTLQTGAAILEEGFNTAFFRFNDKTFAELRPSLSPADHAPEYVLQWNPAVKSLADVDALRLLISLSQTALPSDQPSAPAGASAVDEFFHARIQGRTKGTFDVYYDSIAPEQVVAGQLRTVDDQTYYDVWTSFALPAAGKPAASSETSAPADNATRAVEISSYKIRAEIKPPTMLEAEAVLHLRVQHGGRRTVVFELARTLVVKDVEADGHPVEFIHNPAMEGTQLARRGNDLLAVVFPHALQSGQRIELRFRYGGEALSESGPGLLYVGDRGTWYPNRGLAMADFDLEFRYPAGWTLVATGKRNNSLEDFTVPGDASRPPGEQTSRWISERPIPIAGFNLGKFHNAVAHAGEVSVSAFATSVVERGFPTPQGEVLRDPARSAIDTRAPIVVPAEPPSPARNAQMVANASARAIEAFSHQFGPYPYSDLALTQMPGNLSQGWPGLIFLSSFSFLTDEEKSRLHMGSVDKTLISSVVAHETAHQWWGDLVLWNNYRDQWISEALANYSALMLLEARDPVEFRAVMTQYRDDLLQKNKADVPLLEDGPVTLGTRLSCSEFPDGYQAISYGRGTWLLHMLRYMLRDAARKNDGRTPGAEDPFLQGLHRLRDRYAGKPVTTRQVLEVFEEDLPHSLWYEGHKSLAWFYDGWISGTAVPRYELHGVKYTEKAGVTTITGTILQKDAPDDLVTPVPLYASVGNRQVFLGRVLADGPETPFRLNTPSGARKVIIDPDQTLLARSR